jgi:hypothetical protein
MTTTEVDALLNFSWNERDVFGRFIFEQHEGIDAHFMKHVDWMVTIAKEIYGPGTLFIVHDINQGKHSDDSMHYKGRAIDGHFAGLPVRDQALFAMRYFFGVGCYPDWNNPGIHVDDRLGPPTYWVKFFDNYDFDWRNFSEFMLGGKTR